MKKVYAEFFPDSALHPDAQWGKIVNPAHHARVKNILDRTQGEILVGGEVDGDKRIAPTVVAGVKPDDSLMEEYVADCLVRNELNQTGIGKSSDPCCQSLRLRISTTLSA